MTIKLGELYPRQIIGVILKVDASAINRENNDRCYFEEFLQGIDILKKEPIIN